MMGRTGNHHFHSLKNQFYMLHLGFIHIITTQHPESLNRNLSQLKSHTLFLPSILPPIYQSLLQFPPIQKLQEHSNMQATLVLCLQHWITFLIMNLSIYFLLSFYFRFIIFSAMDLISLSLRQCVDILDSKILHISTCTPVHAF